MEEFITNGKSCDPALFFCIHSKDLHCKKSLLGEANSFLWKLWALHLLLLVTSLP